MPDINGLGSVSNASYSFGSSDLRLPTTPTNFSAMPSFYADGSGGLPNSGQTNFSFSNPSLSPSLNVGAGGGTGKFGSDFFAKPAILSGLQVQFSTSSTTGSNRSKPTTANLPTASAGGPVVLAPRQIAPIDSSVLAGAGFSPKVYANSAAGANPVGNSTSAPLTFSVLRDSTRINTLANNSSPQTSFFSRATRLANSGSPITFSFANGNTLNGGNPLANRSAFPYCGMDQRSQTYPKATRTHCSSCTTWPTHRAMRAIFRRTRAQFFKTNTMSFAPPSRSISLRAMRYQDRPLTTSVLKRMLCCEASLGQVRQALPRCRPRR
jgi:hypothetical protein